jgi:anaerobic selenocysteine-containing dehydrogenase
MRRVQRFAPAAAPVGQARPGWEALRDLAVRFGVATPFDSAADVMAEIARVAPPYAGVDPAAMRAHDTTAPTDVMLPFAPRTSARDVSYGGTAYDTEHDRGRVWPTSDIEGDAARAYGGGAADDDLPPDGGPSAGSDLDGAGGLRLVPVDVLYDRGRLIAPSSVLWPFVPDPYVEVGSADAAAAGLADGEQVRVTSAVGSVEAELRVREGLAPGTVRAPESLAWSVPIRALLDGRPWAAVHLERAPSPGSGAGTGDDAQREGRS